MYFWFLPRTRCDETNVKRVLIRADFGDTGQVVVYFQGQHMGNTPRPHLLEDATLSGVPELFSTVSQQMQNNAEAPLDRQQRRQPFLKITPPRRVIQMQPVMIRGQIEFAGTTRYADSLLDTHQP